VSAADPWKSGRARVAATRGIAQARRRNRVEIVREGAVYRPQCCNRPFRSWHDAGEHIIENRCQPTPEGETV
jgi:hypothetical protein